MLRQKNIPVLIHTGKADKILPCRRHVVSFASRKYPDLPYIHITCGRQFPERFRFGAIKRIEIYVRIDLGPWHFGRYDIQHSEKRRPGEPRVEEVCRKELPVFLLQALSCTCIVEQQYAPVGRDARIVMLPCRGSEAGLAHHGYLILRLPGQQFRSIFGGQRFEPPGITIHGRIEPDDMDRLQPQLPDGLLEFA